MALVNTHVLDEFMSGITERAFAKFRAVHRTTLVTPPRHRDSWWELLPGDYKTNPKVIVVMSGVDWTGHLMNLPSGKTLGVLQTPGGFRGLQVLSPMLDTYMEVVAEFDANGMEMADPAFIGRLGDIPQDLLLKTDFYPLVFLREAMWRDHLNLRRVWKRAPNPA